MSVLCFNVRLWFLGAHEGDVSFGFLGHLGSSNLGCLKTALWSGEDSFNFPHVE